MKILFSKSLFFLLLFLSLKADGLWAMGGTVPNGYPNTFLMGMVSNYFPDVNNEYGYGINAQVYTLNTWEGPVGGASFDMSYRYLNAGYYSGGTTPAGNGWSNSPFGAGYVLKHHADLCKQYNYEPVFIYYQIGNYGAGEGGTSPTDPNGMGLYYQDWTYTMYLIDQWMTANASVGYTPVVTVDVEPDFSGSVEQNNIYPGFGPTNFGMNVANCTIPSAALAAPGTPAWVSLTGFGNNFQGYCAALLHIKDQVVSAGNNNRIHIAFHISNWAVNGNPAVSTGYPYPLAQVAARATTISNFVNACQPASGSKFDLFFTDPSGYDGYNPVVAVGPPPNVYDWSVGGVVGIADQYAYFLNQISTLTNLRGILWQMPLGNSKMSNTNGHYKDERPEYFLADSPLNDQGYAHNVCQYMASGVIGILWGAGSITTSTSVEDMLYSSWTEDGTANGGSGSWTVPAVIDNDGGFMRSHAANAHLWANQCGATNTATASATSTATNTVTHTVTNSATSTVTHSSTASATNTATSSPTNSATVTSSATNSATATVTSSATATTTSTSTATSLSSATSTSTQTLTSTVTNPSTATSTPTATATMTSTNTSLYTVTNTQTLIPTTPAIPAATSTNTATTTYTFTLASTATATSTGTATASMTDTATGASTATSTSTGTCTATSTGTDTPHPMNTFTGTATRTATASATLTATATVSMTFTTTASATLTSSPTFTAPWTATWSATPSPYDFFVSKNAFSPNYPVTINVSFNQGPGVYVLSVYNSAGEHIVQLGGEKVEGATSKIYTWNGKNKYGSLCASGVYVIRLTEPMHVRYARILFIR